MKSQVKERIYLLVMVFCLLMCAVLLISVFCDLPIATIKRETHTPVIRTTLIPAGNETETLSVDEGLAITEDALSRQMNAFLPASFPSAEFEVEIDSGGLVEVEFTVAKADIKEYFDAADIKMGVKQSLVMGMLPKALEIDVSLLCVSADKSGIQLTPQRLEVNDKEMDLSFLPQSVFDSISGAINAALAYTGLDYTAVIFSDGAIILK